MIKQSSGVNPPFTVVESHSMQHCQYDDRHSELGIIDTGDMILVRNPSKTDIVTYVEGSQTGYSSFGEYGDVIVYYRNAGNPVIHRAFIWLDLNSDGTTWSAPSLAGYSSWTCDESTDYNKLSGTLTFTKVGSVVEGGKTVSVDLDLLISRGSSSGYLTLGDSISNTNFDQSSGIISTTISEKMIKSVAWKEIPWLGAVKLMVKGNTSELNNWASNSKAMLAYTLVGIIVIVFSIECLVDEVRYLRTGKKD